MCWAGHGEGEHGGIWASLSDVLTSTDGPQPRTGPPRRRRRAPGPWHAAAGRKRSRGHGDAGPCHDACFARSEATRPRVSRSVSAGASRPRSGGRAAGLPAAQARTPHADSRVPHPVPTPPTPAAEGTSAQQGQRTPSQGCQEGVCPSCEGSQNTWEDFCSQGPFESSNNKTPVASARGHPRRGLRSPCPLLPHTAARPPYSSRKDAQGEACAAPPPKRLGARPAARRDPSPGAQTLSVGDPRDRYVPFPSPPS